MKDIEEYIIPERKEKILKSITCDICGFCEDKDEQKYFNSHSSEWYHFNNSAVIGECNITVSRADTIGDFNPTTKISSYDICPNCWETKVVPFLESLGAKPTVTEYEE